MKRPSKKKAGCLIIAEIGGNFTSYGEAKRLIDAAKRCGADAVKLQTFRADTLSTKTALFTMENTGRVSQYELFKKYEISEKLHRRIFDYAERSGLDWFSTPSHASDVDMLDKLGVRAHKIGSDDAVNIPFLRYVAKKRKPILLSTGMCTLAEVRESVDAIFRAGNRRLTLLHAVTSYPTHAPDVNLRSMQTLMREFPDLEVGYSDHTLGINAPLAAVALGARVIEKHFTLDKNAPGPDHMLSADPAEMKRMVDAIREIEVMLGDGIKRPAKGERLTRINNRKSLVSQIPIAKGERFRAEHLAIKRPGYGLPPRDFDRVVGKIASRNISSDEVLTAKDIR